MDVDRLVEDLAQQVENDALVKQVKSLRAKELAAERLKDERRQSANTEFEQRARTLRELLDDPATSTRDLAKALEAAAEAERRRRV